MKRFFVLLLVIAAGITAGAFLVPADAATVNNDTISQSALNNDLSAISNNRDYQCLLSADVVARTNGESSLPPLGGVGQGTYNTTFVDYWLSQMINARLIDQLVQHEGITVTSYDTSLARSDLESSYTSALSSVADSQYSCGNATAASILSNLPTSFVNEQVQLQANSEALLAHPYGGQTVSALRRYFSQHRSTFDTLCVSGIVASSESSAASLRTQIEQGASFAQVAKSSSLDTTTAPNGGALGCFSPGQSEYSSVVQDVGSLAVGQVSQPLATEDGEYVILQVTKRTPSAFSGAQSAVRQALLAAGNTAVSSLVTKTARRSHITVSPQYGRWSVGSAMLGVQPPVSPPSSSILNLSAVTPSSTSSSAASSPGSSASGTSSSSSGTSSSAGSSSSSSAGSSSSSSAGGS